MKLVRDIYHKTKIIGTVAQKDPNVDEPGPDEMFKVGTMAQLLRILEMPDGSNIRDHSGEKAFQYR